MEKKTKGSSDDEADDGNNLGTVGGGSVVAGLDMEGGTQQWPGKVR